jgi:mono/diheme cytochrome c family protein
MAHDLRKHSVNIRIVFFSFLSFSLFCCQSGPPPGMTDPGELIYFGYVNKQAQCSRCHGDEGQGGMFGPQIRGAVKKLGADSVRAIITDGKGEGDKRMPGLAKELTPSQIEQVINFLQTWEDAAVMDSTARHGNGN